MSWLEYITSVITTIVTSALQYITRHIKSVSMLKSIIILSNHAENNDYCGISIQMQMGNGQRNVQGYENI